MKDLLIITLLISGVGIPIALYIVCKELEKDNEINQV